MDCGLILAGWLWICSSSTVSFWVAGGYSVSAICPAGDMAVVYPRQWTIGCMNEPRWRWDRVYRL